MRAIRGRGIQVIFSLLALAFLAIAPLRSQAAPVFFSTKSGVGHNHFQLDSFRGSTPEDLHEISENIIERISKLKERYPNLHLDLHIDEHLLKDPEAKAQLEEFLAPLRQELPSKTRYTKVKKHPFRSSLAKFKRSTRDKFRWTFTLLRGGFMTAATGLSLRIVEGLDWGMALSAGLGVGALSASVQHFSHFLYEGFINKTGVFHRAITKILTSLGVKLSDSKEKKLEKINSWVEQVGKWYAMELVFVEAAKLTLTTLGLGDPESANLWWTAALATMAQGTWDLEVGKQVAIKKLQGFSQEDRLYFSKLGLLGASVLSTGVLMTLKLFDVPFADWGFYAMGAAGVWRLVQSSKKHSRLLDEDTQGGPCQMRLSIR